ncbi:nudix family hydrolase like [Lecanosticta acicola]|uniref:Nudix family hydrolase like n=1 Tax=Lecanosticta acicola TaxID=111012 RepID=A0AAI8YX96_9PEZI|nr:nudix family hydrolase like [Lecanosticta acicola]
MARDQLMSQLQTLLRDLRSSPYPELESPEETKRRASVAFIIRISPSYDYWPSSFTENVRELDSFFEQEWVQHGSPQVLFIKRASRKGDRWTSHIALPGGKRDSTDADDKAAAVREAWEEVGVDLDKYAVEAGNLPQRMVTTHWGKKPLLVLCPYVFLLTQHEIPPLKLQPSEVAATHWVPLRKLLDPKQRTVVFEDVSSRLANQETGVKKWMLSMILGKMQFAAIHLQPTESLHSEESPAEHALQDNRFARLDARDEAENLISRIRRSDLFNQYPLPKKEGPLLLWGLTLGVVSDFLDLIPPHNALELWSYPTFTPLDVRFTVWLLTYRFKNRKRAELQSGSEFRDLRPSFGTASESYAPGNADVSASTVIVERPDETGLHGLGTGSGVGDFKGNKAAVATMLEGFVESLARLTLPEITNRARYYDIVRRAVALALVGRMSAFVVLAALAWRRYGKK